jgi:RNA polymerase sigma-70 factor (ECF subfamily)
MDTPAMDDLTRDLILAQDGDLEAFSRAARLAQPDIRRFCSWITGTKADLDDLEQETLLRMYRHLDSFRVESRGISWILSIARRVCLDHARQSTRRRRLSIALEHHTAIAQHYNDSSTIHLEQSIHDLPEPLRESFVLVKLFGFTYAEVADIIGCPLGTVQSRVARARALLVTVLADGVGAERDKSTKSFDSREWALLKN